jgi:hypothetical protein
MSRVLFTLGSTLVLGGCALVTSFDGFGGGRAGDGGAAGSSSGGSGGASGGSGSSSGAGSTYCGPLASQYTFCADFDEGSVTTGWVNGVLQSAAADKKNDVSVSNAPVVSAPGSLQARAGGAVAFSDLEVNLTNAPHGNLHVEFDLSPDNMAAMPVIEIDFCDGDCRGAPPYDFELLINQGGNLCIGEHGMGCTDAITPVTSPPAQAWSHISLDANMTTGNLSLGLASITTLTLHGTLTLLPPTLPSALLVFGFGIPSTSPGGSLHLDNVLFATSP